VFLCRLHYHHLERQWSADRHQIEGKQFGLAELAEVPERKEIQVAKACNHPNHLVLAVLFQDISDIRKMGREEEACKFKGHRLAIASV
jgi:hypothetical protein